MLGYNAMVETKQRAGGELIATDREVVPRLIYRAIARVSAAPCVEGALPSRQPADWLQILLRFAFPAFPQCHEKLLGSAR